MGEEGKTHFKVRAVGVYDPKNVTVGKTYATLNPSRDGSFMFKDDAYNVRDWDEDECLIEWVSPPVEDSPFASLDEFPTGALRESKDGKGRPDLLLAGFPRALRALSKHMDCPLGRERNWEKGLPESSLVASQFRHLTGYTSGVSSDTPEYNLTANVWNAMVLLETYLRVQDGVMPDTLLDIAKEPSRGQENG